MATSEQNFTSLQRVDFRMSPTLLLMNWVGLVVVFAYSIFGAFIWYIFVSNIGDGLGSAIRDSAKYIHDEEWFVKMVLLISPMMAVSTWSGFTRLKQPPGFLEVRPEGLLIACYTLGPMHLSGFGDWFTWGMTKWDNLSDVGVVKRSFIRGVGLQFENLDDFLKSRRLLERDDFAKRGRQGPYWARVTLGWLILSPIGKCLGLLWNIQGLTAPKSVEEKDVLLWNCENFGYHIVIRIWSLPCSAKGIAEAIANWRPSTEETVPDTNAKA